MAGGATSRRVQSQGRRVTQLRQSVCLGCCAGWLSYGPLTNRVCLFITVSCACSPRLPIQWTRTLQRMHLKKEYEARWTQFGSPIWDEWLERPCLELFFLVQRLMNAASFSNNTKKHAVRGVLQSQRNQPHQQHQQLQHSPYGYTAKREQFQWTWPRDDFSIPTTRHLRRCKWRFLLMCLCGGD